MGFVMQIEKQLLPPEMRRAKVFDMSVFLETVRDSGETLLWSGQPDPAIFKQKMSVTGVIGFLWVSIIGVILPLVMKAIRKNGSPVSTQVMIMVFVILAPLLLAGLVMFLKSFRLTRGGLRTIYAVTDKRCMIVEKTGKYLTLKNQNYITGLEIRAYETKPGVGTIAIITPELMNPQSTNESAQTVYERLGAGLFVMDGIYNVLEVEKIVNSAKQHFLGEPETD